jgi:hypothetical protein
MSRKFSTIAALSLTTLFAATAVACDLDDPTAPPPSYQVTFSSNASTVNSSQIPELNLAGAVNDDGVGFSAALGPDGRKYRLTVKDGEFVAYSPGGPVAEGEKMVGWSLLVTINGKADQVQILGYQAGPVSQYALAMRDGEGVMKNICPSFADSPSEPASTLIFGERYDFETKEVIAEQESWVNFACRGEALFKMKAMGYVPDETKAIHRQATLKMLTADYCGSGHSFTEDGTPLIMQNNEGTIGKDAGELGGEVEALWNEYGALCLTTPRLASLDEIAEHCTLPVCDEELIAKGADFAWRTWVPAE